MNASERVYGVLRDFGITSPSRVRMVQPLIEAVRLGDIDESEYVGNDEEGEMKRSHGKAEVRPTRFGYGTTAHIVAHIEALEIAVERWVTEHEEAPPWDEVNFRGGHTTTEVVIELTAKEN